MKIKFLKAFNGDSIHIDLQDDNGKSRNILIDGGTGGTFSYKDKKGKIVAGDLKLAIEKIKESNEKIDLLILTHVDDDHIGGILKWFEKDSQVAEVIGKIWFNSGRLIAENFEEKEIETNLIPLKIFNGTDTSITQGITFEDFITKYDIWDRRLIKEKEIITEFGIEFKVLSPTLNNLELLLKKWEKEAPETLTASKRNDYEKSLRLLIDNDSFIEDDSVPNGSSIAFILTYNSKNMLFLGDAHPTSIIESLRHFGYSPENPLKAEIVKLSHHGSKFNTNDELLQLIDCENFVISSNGAIHNLPDKQCLARIVNAKSNVIFYFNYPEKIDEIFTKEDFQEFQFDALPGDQEFIF